MASLYQKELLGGVEPADVDPQIAANFTANRGPHIYTTEEITAYKLKLTLPDEVPLSLDPNQDSEYPNSTRDTELEMGDDEMDVKEEEAEKEKSDEGSGKTNKRVRKKEKPTARMLRRSRRITETTFTKHYSLKKANESGSQKGKRKAINDTDLTEALKIVEALQDEVLGAIPL